MPIQLAASGFYEWHDRLGAVPSLGIQSDRLEECIAHYHAQGFRGLFGNPTFGFAQDNLDFLAQTANATDIWFWDVALRNVDAIYALTQLECFGVHPKRPGIDFSRFPALRLAINHWAPADQGIANSTIGTYYLWHFKPKSKSFAGLEIPDGVTKLEFTWANPASLEGLPVLKKLKELQFHRCRNLTDLSALPRIAPNLEKLLVTTSSRIDPTAGILDHPKLKMALINGKHHLETGAIR
jgi:hypothetical protein